MNKEEIVEHLETNLERLLGWIAAADTKTSTVFAFSTVMLGVLAGLFPKADGWTFLAGLCAAGAAISLGTSLLFSTFAAFPRTSGPRGSLVFFGGIAGRKLDAYLEDVKAVTYDSYLVDLAGQCHRNAQIAASKFEWVKRSMIALYVSVLPWLTAIFLLYWSR